MKQLLKMISLVSFKGHKKVDQILLNIKGWCKRWSEIPFECNCHLVKHIINAPFANGHISCLGFQTSSSLNKVLHANLNNVCAPDKKRLPHEIFEQVNLFVYSVKNLSALLDLNMMCQSVSPIPKLFIHAKLNKALSLIESYGPSSSTLILKTLSEIDKFCKLPTSCVSIPTHTFLGILKNLERVRGFFSYYNHPLKIVYFRATVGLMCCLKNLPFPHTNIFSPPQVLFDKMQR
jgi:hypothetical protein